MMSDLTNWENLPYETRPLPLGRFLHVPSGMVRKLISEDMGKDKHDMLVMQVNLLDFPARCSRDFGGLSKRIQTRSFRYSTREAVLLPEDWTPGKDLPPHPVLLKREEENKARKIHWEELEKKNAERRQREQEEHDKLKAHLQKQWDDSEYVLVSFQNNAFNQIHIGHFKGEPRAKNWVARVWRDEAVPGGMGRDFLNRVPGNYPAVMVDKIRVGDYLEVAADLTYYNGDRKPDRLYFRVIKDLSDIRGRIAVLHRLPDKPPSPLDEPSQDQEMLNLVKWLNLHAESPINNSVDPLLLRSIP